MASVNSNPIWLYFEKVDLSKAKCKDCDKIYSLGSEKPKFQTLHGLKTHLAKCHKDVNEAYLKKVSEHSEASARKKR